ncbi:hypothetical protein IMSHALPRED_009505 [Imshaugia aleurites]|uniref:3'-5' exonuclease domain-containing protein n=1 Tax=Imshaugia aleurites TaxID=172621 RepID=A0A8H3G6G6_9LECA|nr:hypothetical protein IMSHALPRED_009505 [Imshaugia aleurites]
MSKAKAGNMKVTIVDSESSVVALIDDLDNLPAQPPSLYLDIEGVNLSRHGSISIVQIFVLPKNHVFLLDVFGLKEAAFCTSNRFGTNLRSILESALVPKVFFDVRNDSDALFAHFQILMHGVHDVQLLEVATRSYSKERLCGLAMCINRDAYLTQEASAAWKATKEKGLSRFAPEHGGSYEVFNIRPMLQDIVDYCTQDVLYLPLLWKRYTRKISTHWKRKVQEETWERVLLSQTASYEPHGKDKSMSPWANHAKSGKGNCSGNNVTRGPEKEKMITVAQIAATKAANKTAVTQPGAKAQSQPLVGQGVLRRSARLAAQKAAQKTRDDTADPEGQPPKLDLPIKSKNDLEGESRDRTGPTLYPATVYSKWTCTSCCREMQNNQKEKHLAGKQHIARVKRAAFTNFEAARQTRAAKEKTLRATNAPMTDSEKRMGSNEAETRQTIRNKAQDTGSMGKKKQRAVPKPQQRGLPYPPDHLFIEFGGSIAPRNIQYETAFSGGDENYAVCDKDCGWCGHCMDGIDI